MNRTNSTQYEFYLTKAQWYEIFGYSLTLDSFILFLATPVSLAGIVLNMLSFYILSNKKFEFKIIFSYLRVYSFNSMLLCLVLSTYFSSTYNYFDATNSFLSRAYTSKVYIPIVTVLAFFSGFLDILISVERLLDFYPHIKKTISLKSCFILMFVVVVITLPYFFIYYPAHIDVNLSETETFRLHYIGLSEFGHSSTGEVVNYALFFIKDVLTFIVEIVLNVSILVLLKKNLNKIKLMIRDDDSKLLKSSQQQTSSMGKSDSSTQLTFKTSNSYAKFLASRKNKSITIMVVVISVFSGFAHISTIMCNSCLAIAQNSLSSSFCFSAIFFLAFKSFSNFFIFLFFNSIFYAEMKKLIGVKSAKKGAQLKQYS